MWWMQKGRDHCRQGDGMLGEEVLVAKAV